MLLAIIPFFGIEIACKTSFPFGTILILENTFPFQAYQLACQNERKPKYLYLKISSFFVSDRQTIEHKFLNKEGGGEVLFQKILRKSYFILLLKNNL